MTSGCRDDGGHVVRGTAVVGAATQEAPASRVGTRAPTTAPQRSCTAGQHGTVHAYQNLGCRCPDAREAVRRYAKRLRWEHARGHRRTIDATGTRRRLQALAANGWSYADLGRRLGGITPQAVGAMTRNRQIYVTSARAVAALYDALWRQRGPSPRTAALAENRGWLPPLWWDDDAIDDPTYDPRADVLLHPEDELAPARRERAHRLEQVARLTAAGKSARDIAAVCGVSSRQVVRDRADLNLTDVHDQPERRTQTGA